MRYASYIFFFAVFLVAFAVHLFLWHAVELIDEPLWITRLDHLIADFHDGFRNSSPQRYASHPGMAVLTVGFLFSQLGLPLTLAFRIALSLIIAASVATVAAGCRVARPHLAWWLPASALVLLHPLYFHASPTTAVMGPVTCALFVLALLLYEHRSSPLALHVAVSVFLGTALATRLMTTLIIGALLLALLARRLPLRRVLAIGMLSLLAMTILNPLLWHFPVQHGIFVVFKLDQWIRNPLTHTVSLADFVFLAPGALFSVVLGLSLVLARRTLSLPVPLPYLGALLLVAILLSAAVAQLPTQSLRYYFPILFLWEMFLPLWALHLLEYVSAHRPLLAHASTVLAICMALGQALLFVYLFLLPERIHII